MPDPTRPSLYGRTRALLARLFDDAATDWGLGKPVVGLIVVIPVLVVLVGCITALMGKPAYKWFVTEDGFAETLQVIAFAVAAVTSTVVGFRMRGSGPGWLGALFLVAGLFLLWVVGEEVSWGQRIAEVETPEMLVDVNRQGEMNLHNIYPIEKALRWCQLLVGLWGAVMPFVVRRYWTRLKRWGREVVAFVPHYTLVLYFASTFLWRTYRQFAPPPPERLAFVVSEWSEVIELNLALGIAFHMLYLLQRSERDDRGLALPGGGTA